MNHFLVWVLISILILLILLSAFFSCAETALMAINRYRLRHKARLNDRFALLTLRLLKRPDRLLGMILIGNNISNIVASAIMTVLAASFFGNEGVIIFTGILTLVVLVFAEVAPKTFAAFYPEAVVKIIAVPIFLLLKVFYPLVWLINGISNGLLRLFRIRVNTSITEPLSREELRSVVYETSGRMSHHYQNMLLSILDLNKITVNDVMVPKHQIIGIDLNKEWKDIQMLLTESLHNWLPVYYDNINQIVGMLHLREMANRIMLDQTMDKDLLSKMTYEPYFIPENTPLNTQLVNFQQQGKRIALVVDEYGDIQGLVTLADILEEIVGEFNAEVNEAAKLVYPQPDGSYLLDGAMMIRELNRMTNWNLPVKGPRTLSGLIIEYLEALPHSGVCVRIGGYPMEVVQIQENRIKKVRIFPGEHREV